MPTHCRHFANVHNLKRGIKEFAAEGVIAEKRKKMLWTIFSRGLKIAYIDCQGMQTCYKVNFGEVFKKRKK